MVLRVYAMPSDCPGWSLEREGGFSSDKKKAPVHDWGGEVISPGGLTDRLWERPTRRPAFSFLRRASGRCFRGFGRTGRALRAALARLQHEAGEVPHDEDRHQAQERAGNRTRHEGAEAAA